MRCSLHEVLISNFSITIYACNIAKNKYYLFTDESTLDSKVPVRFRLGLNKQVQDTRESKTSRKASKRQGRKVKHKVNLTVTNNEHIL